MVKLTNKISSEAKRYLEFCKTFGFKQLIATIANQSSTQHISLIDHILTNTNEKIAQFELINVGLSDHQMFISKFLSSHLKSIQLMSMKSSGSSDIS